MYFTDQLKVNEGSCGFDRSDQKKKEVQECPTCHVFWNFGGVQINVLNGHVFPRVAPQLLTTSNFIGPWFHAALLFLGLGSVVCCLVYCFLSKSEKTL